jgi:two-component system response regulator AtoC
MPSSSLSNAQILLVEDTHSQAEMIASHIRGREIHVFVAESVAQARDIVRHHEVDLALLDLNLPDGYGLDLLAELRETDSELPAIIFTGYATVRNAVIAMQQGALDFLEKPFTLESLDLAIDRAMDMNQLRREIRQLRRMAFEGRDSPILGTSPAMQELWSQAEKAALTNSTIIITGENGTGKDVIARLIHSMSRRSDGPFIAVNCGSITQTLIEDHLFGHEAHAFTGAQTMRRGDFELAHKGTIFLDEIGEMPLNLQPALLRVLEERKFFRIGGEREIQVDVRVIAATNRDLKEAVETGIIRQDLFFRLNVIMLHIPPLRERRQDIPLFVVSFLQSLGRALNKSRKAVSKESMQLLYSYDWPGNVRQLRNVIERALILCNGPEIRPEHLPPEISGIALLHDNGVSDDSKWEQWIDVNPFVGLHLDDMLSKLECRLIIRTLRQYKNRSDVARTLGLTLDGLRYRMSKYGIAD